MPDLASAAGPPPTLRDGSAADAAAIAAVHRSQFEIGWSDRDVAGLLVLPTTECLVAVTADTAIIGFAMVQRVGEEAEILSIAVASAWQRQGIAGRLLWDMAVRLRERGVRRWLLEVAADNEPALALYGRHGFATIGRRRGYYHRIGARPVDALLQSGRP